MVILFIILLFVCLWNIKLSSFHKDYISPDSTNAIKGIFAVIILFSHMKGYITLNSTFSDYAFSAILRYIGQLMVAMYLFYSGYGILESIKRKANYLDTYPKKRILKTLVHFDLAVLCYLIVMTSLGSYYTVLDYITCWIGWRSIGNSNWFIFDILALYVIVYVANLIARKFKCQDNKLCWVVVLTSIMSVVLWIFLFIAGKESWWVDTIITFPLGMWFSLLREKIEIIICDRRRGIVIVILFVLLFIIWHSIVGNDILGICASIFCLMIVTLSTRVKFDNKVLQWLGTQSFAIYIIQRLPMNLFSYLGINSYNHYAFAALVVPTVLLLAWLFNKLLTEIDRILLMR